MILNVIDYEFVISNVLVNTAPYKYNNGLGIINNIFKVALHSVFSILKLHTSHNEIFIFFIYYWIISKDVSDMEKFNPPGISQWRFRFFRFSKFSSRGGSMLWQSLKWYNSMFTVQFDFMDFCCMLMLGFNIHFIIYFLKHRA